MNPSQPGRRILLLHNEPASIVTLTTALEKAGFHVVEGSLSNLALHELVHDPPYLILATEGAGGHSVETLTRNLKQDAFLGRLPLIVFVRDSRLNDIDWGTLGVDDFITIPYRAEDVVREADIALSAAKPDRSGGVVTYAASMRNNAASLVHLEADLHVALERREFRLLFQPIVDLHDGRYVGAEAQADDGEPFGEKMQRLAAQLRQQQAEAAKLDAAIAANLKELGYGG